MSWWRFWTWGDRPKVQPQQQLALPSAVRSTNTTPKITSAVQPVAPVRPVTPVQPVMPVQSTPIDDDEDDVETDEDLDTDIDDEIDEPEEEEEEEEGDVPFPEFKPLPSFKTVNVPASYAELARSIGYAPPDLIYAKLEKYFVDQSIPIAECEDVREWLTDRLDYIDANSWYWRPLRAQDELVQTSWGDDYDSGDQDCRVYDRDIPLRVLERVAKMIAEFGNNLRFYVSDFSDLDYDEERQRADCFIMVFPANHPPGVYDDNDDFYFVFDTWEKPGYEDNKSLIPDLKV